MSVATITCQQAIFTSIRAPTGEGYRIVAASRGLRPDEKQTITRSSPSHDSLCDRRSRPRTVRGVGRPAQQDGDEQQRAGNTGAQPLPHGVAFYPLPGGRLCTAASCYAGVEHTGRGGQRVYTYNVIFDPAELPKALYNPFAIVRAMDRCGLIAPQLSPAPVLPDLTLEITDDATAVPDIAPDELLSADWRTYVLQALLEERNVILSLPAGWSRTAEMLLLGVPGPLRSSLSFSAGLRFSLGRCHRLSLLNDDPRQIRTRITAQPIQLLMPAEGPPPEKPAAAWYTFVERHFSRGRLTTLARRTSRDFPDLRCGARERIARLYNDLDDCERLDTGRLLKVAGEQIRGSANDPENEIAAELLLTVQRILLDRFRPMPWSEAVDYWPALCTLWRKSKEGCLFAFPLIEQAIEAAGRLHPAVAAEATLDILRDVPSRWDDSALHQKLYAIVRRSAPSAPASATAQPFDPVNDLAERALSRLADWAETAAADDLSAIGPLYRRWQAAMPHSSVLSRLHHRCMAAQNS